MSQAGTALLEGVQGLLESLPTPAPGPQALATLLGVDKVLASRVLKMLRASGPIEAVHRAPGPEPLRRLIRGGESAGASSAAVDRAQLAVDALERLIRHDAGDRSALDAVLSAWAPEARREFELRRKQALFRAMSQLKGSQTETLYASVFLHPGTDPEKIDIAWVNGLYALQRLRPGARVKLAARWIRQNDEIGQTRSLTGEAINGAEGLVLDAFGSSPRPPIEVHRAGEVTHYTLGGEAFGQGARADVVFAEHGPDDMPRYIEASANRKRFVYAEVSVPTKKLVFDALIHRDLETGPAELRVYDTSFEGVASPNDPARELDRLDLLEQLERIEPGSRRVGGPPRRDELIAHVCSSLGWNREAFILLRCEIDYPIYGSQVTMVFPTQPRPH
ncbi:MAG: hypothetical protein ACIARR_11710 [Phycisphaerales bacterium JB059]